MDHSDIEGRLNQLGCGPQSLDLVRQNAQANRIADALGEKVAAWNTLALNRDRRKGMPCCLIVPDDRRGDIRGSGRKR